MYRVYINKSVKTILSKNTLMTKILFLSLKKKKKKNSVNHSSDGFPKKKKKKKTTQVIDNRVKVYGKKWFQDFHCTC